MNVYTYQADLWCEQCGEAIREQLARDHPGKVPADPDQEHTYDSDDYPKGPVADGGGESDMPQFCAAGEECLCTAFGVGQFLENTLTDHGCETLREAIDRAYTNDKVTDLIELFEEFYELPWPGKAEGREPSEEDWVTEDYVTFRAWQGLEKISLRPEPGTKATPADDWAVQLKAEMDRQKFWPDVWWLSDHGNAHRIDLEKEVREYKARNRGKRKRGKQ